MSEPDRSTDAPPPAPPGADGSPTTAAAPGSPTDADVPRRSVLDRVGADWAAVTVAGVLVLLAGLGLLPSIPFLIK